MDTETKEARFVRVAERRVENVLQALRSLAQCANPKIYSWNERQMKKIWEAIDHELASCKQSYGDPTGRVFRL